MACSRKLEFIIVSLLLSLLTAIYMLHHVRPKWVLSSTLQTSQYNNERGQESNAIHMVQMLRGKSASLRSVTMLKSALFYQGRCRTDRLECCGNMTSNTGCPKNITSGKQEVIPLHIHFIRDRNASVLVDVLLRNWRMGNFKYSVYDLENYLHLVEWIPNVHAAGPTALCKMFIASILPESVEKAIVIDSDTLFNYDVHHLWRHFEKFNKSHLLALAWEQQSMDANCKDVTKGPIPPFGVNGGLVLMHLKKMRTMGWGKMRYRALRSLLTELGTLHQGEQDVFNRVISWHPHVYYQLPCEWNMQCYSSVAVSCCPTVWPDRLPYEKDCITRTTPGKPAQPSLLRLAHFDTHPKPEDPDWKATFKKGLKDTAFGLSHAELVDRFNEMYTRFHAIPPHCFT